MKGWGCKRIDFFIPLFFASDTQKDLDRSLYGMPWKKKSRWNIRRNRQYSGCILCRRNRTSGVLHQKGEKLHQNSLDINLICST